VAREKLKSMTGFGRATVRVDGVSAAVEIRGVNQRFLRIGVRVPAHLAVLEAPVREIVQKGPRRGQIDATVAVEDGLPGGALLPDARLVRAYVEAWRGVAEELGLPGHVDVGTLAAMPQMFAAERQTEAVDRARPAVEAAAAKALAAFERMRAVEGDGLGRALKRQLDKLDAMRRRIGSRAKASKGAFAAKLTERVNALLERIGASESVSQANLEREIVLHADRTDVSEELQRIDSHIGQFRSTLAAGSPAGRKLEFLVQELQREITTLGAKIADAEAGREAVEFKAEIEKIREQIQNVE